MNTELLEAALEAEGYALVPAAVSPLEAQRLRALFQDDAAFRKTIQMERHGYGRGVYRYFSYPLPAAVQNLREQLYAALAPIANEWSRRLGSRDVYPKTLSEMIQRCADANQLRPTPLLLTYESGDYNALHQDVYGSVSFPFQATLLLSRPNDEFTGGEFVLYESRARRQSVARVVPLSFGDAVIFPNAHRPNAKGARSQFRHGVSVVRSGRRTTLGVILHDAQ
ncbi:MAG TPA: 2OG-Fe(II) oxygenase [Candidatus Tumulicola sp.]|jgi:hypothetical protein